MKRKSEEYAYDEKNENEYLQHIEEITLQFNQQHKIELYQQMNNKK